MPRKIIPLSETDPYHITARCINKQWFDIPMNEVWSIMEDYLWILNKGFGIEIFSFVLMSNHFHMIVRQPQMNLSESMQYFMRETSRTIGGRAGRINQTYGSRFFRSRIGNLRYFHCAYKYVYRNPVEARLCLRPEDYPYSTLPGLIGKTRISIPLVEDFTLFEDFENTITWLNEAPTIEALESVRRALKKAQMEFVPIKNKKNPLVEFPY